MKSLRFRMIKKLNYQLKEKKYSLTYILLIYKLTDQYHQKVNIIIMMTSDLLIMKYKKIKKYFLKIQKSLLIIKNV